MHLIWEILAGRCKGKLYRAVFQLSSKARHHRPDTPNPHRTGCRLVPCVYVSLLMSSAADNQLANNPLIDRPDNPGRLLKHHRTESLPTGYPLFQEPGRIGHGRTYSAPLTGDEVTRAIVDKAIHSSCKAVNGTDMFTPKKQFCRRASTGTRSWKTPPGASKSMYDSRAAPAPPPAPPAPPPPPPAPYLCYELRSSQHLGIALAALYNLMYLLNYFKIVYSLILHLYFF